MTQESDGDDGYLTGQLLVAMPGMPDNRFSKTVIYMCAHGPEGAMGLVVNKPFEEVSFPDLLDQLEIEPASCGRNIRVQFGGPVEAERGFVLHSPDYVQDATVVMDGDVALTATVDILRAIADGDGPRENLLALGYAGWGPGQLDEEIKANGWLNVTADTDIVFHLPLEDRWRKALGKLGVDPLLLSDDAGHA